MLFREFAENIIKKQLIKICFCGKLYDGLATMAQSVERRLGKAEVTGSIPVSSSNIQDGLGW